MLSILALIIVLISLGIVSAAYSSLVNSRITRLEQFEEEGRSGGKMAVWVASEATRLILSTRGSRGVLRLLVIGLAQWAYASQTGDSYLSIMGIIWGLLIAGFLIGIIEFLAENLVLNHPEEWALRLAPVAFTNLFIMSPITWVMQRVKKSVSSSTGLDQHALVTEAEIMTLVDAGEEGGVIEEDERDMIYSIFQLGDTLAREVMVPRIDIHAFEKSTSLVETTDELLRNGHSRAPVYSETIDKIVGLVYIKDLLAAWRKDEQNETIEGLLREAYFVPEAKKVDDLLAELQVRRIHMAIVVDEYGGTAGLVTIEDIVEEIVGEIRDEYDEAEEAAYEYIGEGEFLFSGKIDLDDVNRIVGSELPKDSGETLGGFIYSSLGRVPSIGDVIETGGLSLVVEQVTGRRIREVRAIRSEIDGAGDGKEVNQASLG
jgi:putative hemolysin